ncbi:hypothetical protein [Cellulomonas shaoxiangyii]|uniref:Uncharacterized protein n=1 Tax=Cellulomonas shaoxiangyii TaxID=2566013 RepID=A0A4V1CMK0_9CELL|nr:hypothetical protein [Cellulomonas shaoxiangyii]QCB93215.1 hypothetical protein E5225_06255 [Cellulomonas shaoxiangyii]TGY81419.1 hypothetical protein E5226_14310 [Cellulomonas shaoxiangyii]
MRFYAQDGPRRARQVVGDLAVLAWVAAWVWVARRLHDVVARLGAPGRTLEDAGTSLRDSLGSAGDSVAGIPVVGDDVRAPFDAAGGAAASIAAAGVQVQEGAARLALAAAVAVALGPVLVVLVAWLRARVSFARRAGAAARLVDSAADLDLFALRALATQPVTRLAHVCDDPAGAWRRGDPDVVRALAALELRSLGVRPPAVAPGEPTFSGR